MKKRPTVVRIVKRRGGFYYLDCMGKLNEYTVLLMSFNYIDEVEVGDWHEHDTNRNCLAGHFQ